MFVLERFRIRSSFTRRHRCRRALLRTVAVAGPVTGPVTVTVVPQHKFYGSQTYKA